MFLRGKEKRSEGDLSTIIGDIPIRSGPTHSCDNHFLS